MIHRNQRGVATYWELGEYIPDAPNINHPGLIRCEDCYPVAGGYRAMPAEEQFSTSGAVTNPGGRLRGAISLFDSTGAVEDYAGDQTKLYRITAAAKAITDVSLTAYATSNSGFWDFAHYGMKVIAVNGGESTNDVPQVKNTGTSTAFANLAGSPPRAQTVATLRDFVVMGNTYDATDGRQPNRVWWSGFGDHEQWTPDASKQSDFQDLEDSAGGVQRILGGNEAFIVCSNSVYRLEYSGPPTIMRRDLIASNIGTTDPLSCVRVGNSLYMWSHGGFVRVGMDGSHEWIGRGRVDVTFGRATVSGEIVSGWYDEIHGGIGWIASGNNGVMYFPSLNKWANISQISGNQYVYSSRLDSEYNQGQATTFYYKSVNSDGNLYGRTDFDDTLPPRFQSGFMEPIVGRKSIVWEAWPEVTYDASAGVTTPLIATQTSNDIFGDTKNLNPITTNITKNTTDNYMQLVKDAARYWSFAIIEASAVPAQQLYKGVRFGRITASGKY